MKLMRFKEVWLIFYKVAGTWQTDGEWFVDRAAAKSQAQANKEEHGWGWRIVPVTLEHKP
jgi:hypothetical protein